ADFGMREPLVRDSLDAGVNLVSFSGDKLLGGQQAGILTGDADLVARASKNPLFRAVRVDKLVVKGLAETLRCHILAKHDEIPALRMLRMSPDEIRARAEKLRELVPSLEIVEGESVAGGGSTPDQTLPTWLLAISGDAVQVERRLRANNIIARIEKERVVIDLRTVFPEEEDELARIVRLSAP
ncbi:MAG TPA: L-seryl-tRNA(Sec) selenium transferase, partial [Bryobacteraceae bacterium]|nr:L-seryl-tRNA(Sec) selenium transferase [Bryobacteraceae bacterium]